MGFMSVELSYAWFTASITIAGPAMKVRNVESDMLFSISLAS